MMESAASDQANASAELPRSAANFARRQLSALKVGMRALPGALRCWEREHWILATFTASTVAMVAAIAPGFANATLQPEIAPRLVQELPLPAPESTEDAAEEALEAIAGTVSQQPQWRVVEVKPGQTMSDIFAEQKLPSATLHTLLQFPGAKTPLSRIRPGKSFEFLIGNEGELLAIRFERDETHVVTLNLENGKVRETLDKRDLQYRVAMAHGEIVDSLYGAAAKAGIGNTTTVELAKVFGYDIDFTQDLRKGDTFSVVYEELWRDGERLRGGEILAATFVNQGKTYHAFRYEFANGERGYYDENGRPLKKSFMRVPVEFTRISSMFTANRKHPVLGKIRAHKGVDYAAPSGTPIVAAGDGRISFAGWQNGYGRTVIIDHGRGYSTLYGHLSSFGKYKTGDRVRQGNVIGAVGMSGLATGPHLHYEFRINGAHRDPMKVTLPRPEPLPKAEFARFRAQTAPMLAKLELMDGATKLATR